MLYLEDFLEVIENLPMEMRERFTDMREADLEVQNTTDNLEEKTKTFFKKCTQSSVKKEWKDDQFRKIKEEYKKAVEQTDEKVQLASQIYEMVDRHLRKLDVELSKFKMELEADNAGITELLEKRSLELDVEPKENIAPREKRKNLSHHNAIEVKKQAMRIPTTIKHEVAPEITEVVAEETVDYSEPNSPGSLSNHSNSLSYTLGTSGTQSTAAIRAAATQAIAATQQMMPHTGRRSTSLKASIEATKKTDQWPTLSESLSSSSQSAADTSHRSQRVKKHTQKAEELIKAQQAKKQAHHPSSQSQLGTGQSPGANAESTDDGQGSSDWAFDPNEPRYCVCNQVSYGEMVGCDNADCTIEWFHYGCVGLTSAPKGKWYCPSCQSSMKRRGGRR
ncbi:inhibitor of growth protein 3-like [Watersipora subatra]|uniref:inhibitor of growth protein 3-like n=1 Tax=Watersipora subatra TaxID=2589382 RepID=UPI00355BC497